MQELPIISYVEAVRAFECAGWRIKRSGTHIIMVKSGSMASLSIPKHHEIAKGTLRKLIRLSGLTVDEFVKFLQK